MRRVLKAGVSSIVLTVCAGVAAPAAAQDSDEAAGQELEAVVVTARKRDETDISVPVSITAMSAAQIERNAILNVYDIAQRAPTLAVNNVAGAGGGAIYLRGIGSNVNAGPSLDQSVSIDLDGVPISRGNILRIGSYDLNQIQMLKGPQALFFGKNSPAGVIALTSKDPTDEFEASVKLGYEAFAHTRSAELVLSGPITDTLKVRLFGRYAKSDGADKNLAAQALPANQIVPNVVFAPTDDRVSGYKDDFVRGTLLWTPTERFTARLKASYDQQIGDGPATVRERFYCPRGLPQNGLIASAGFGATGATAAALASALSVDDCKANGTIFKGNINPAQLVAPNAEDNLGGETNVQTVVGSAEFNYALTEHIDLTAVSGYARITETSYDNYTFGPSSPAALTAHSNVLHRQFTQEVRLQTSFDSPVNVMVGGFYQHAFFRGYNNFPGLPPFNIGQYNIGNDVWSGFAQVVWDVTDQVELAAGARYTEEKKDLVFTRDGVPQVVPVPNVEFTDTSPEATITWRPSEDTTLYGAYRTGFKSGGYASVLVGSFPANSVANDARFIPFNPESAEGFEAGWKQRLLDRTLRLDLTLYNYEYKDLQVSSVDTSSGVPVLRVYNAATAKQKGVEIEANYNPPAIEGLRLHGMVNYNDAKYSDFLSPCFVGQSIAEGCNMQLVGTQFRQQQLKGRRIPNAPLWVGSLGFNYSIPVNSDMRAEFGGDAVYKSAYNPAPDLIIGAHQKASTVLNLHFRVMNEAQGWEFGVFAKNLTDVRRAVEATSGGFTGIGTATGTVNGGIGAWADVNGNITPGRSVLFQLTLRPSVWTQ